MGRTTRDSGPRIHPTMTHIGRLTGFEPAQPMWVGLPTGGPKNKRCQQKFKQPPTTKSHGQPFLIKKFSIYGHDEFWMQPSPTIVASDTNDPTTHTLVAPPPKSYKNLNIFHSTEAWWDRGETNLFTRGTRNTQPRTMPRWAWKQSNILKESWENILLRNLEWI